MAPNAYRWTRAYVVLCAVLMVLLALMERVQW